MLPILLLVHGAQAVFPAGKAGLKLEPRRWVANLQFQVAVASQGLKLLEEGTDIEIRPAGSGKGMGVFCKLRISKGQLLGRYEGQLLSVEEFNEAIRTGALSGDYSYALQSPANLVIDTEYGVSSAWPRYVNHGKGPRSNCDFVEKGETIFVLDLPLDLVLLKSLRDIAPGEELLVDYGDAYWDQRLGPNKYTPRRLMVDYL